MPLFRIVAWIGFGLMVAGASFSPSVFEPEARYEWNQCRQNRAVAMSNASPTISARCRELLDRSTRGYWLGGAGIVILLFAGLMRRSHKDARR